LGAEGRHQSVNVSKESVCWCMLVLYSIVLYIYVSMKTRISYSASQLVPQLVGNGALGPVHVHALYPLHFLETVEEPN
jgi:hypothetical protein